MEYIKYLFTNCDSRVQFNKNKNDYYNQKRPYVGIVMEINGFKYFAPLEHPRNEHKKLKSNPHIIKIEDGKFGIIALGNMIPVPDKYLISFNINDVENHYKYILKRQFIFCRKKQINILENAKKTYENVVIKKIPFYINNCCDFKKLESFYSEYNKIKQYALLD